jgi:hypothetical protein
MHPETVIADVATGSASPAQVRTLQSVDPDTYQDLMTQVTAEVGQNFQTMPSQTKQWLDILFQGDGMAGPAFSWRAAELIALNDERPTGPRAPSALPPPNERVSPNASGLEAISKSVTNRTGSGL